LTNGFLPITLRIMITHQSIIDSIERHCQTHRIAESTFGKRVVNDGKLLSRLRSGKSISIETYNRIVVEIESHQTEAAE